MSPFPVKRHKLLYKFRDLKKENYQYTFDILQNNRLWLSDWRVQNDAIEGHYLPDNLTQEQIRNLYLEKQGYKICSLSRGYRHPLMWGHYAGGCNGIAIGLAFEPSSLDVGSHTVEPVRYIEIKDRPVSNHDAGTAKSILTSKTTSWSYETETRILCKEWDGNYFHGIKIHRVIVGSRVKDSEKMHLIGLCGKKGIELVEMEFCANGIGLVQDDKKSRRD